MKVFQNSFCVLQPLHHKDDVIQMVDSKCICQDGYEELYKNGTCIPNDDNQGPGCDQLDCHRGHW